MGILERRVNCYPPVSAAQRGSRLGDHGDGNDVARVNEAGLEPSRKESPSPIPPSEAAAGDDVATIETRVATRFAMLQVRLLRLPSPPVAYLGAIHLRDSRKVTTKTLKRLVRFLADRGFVAYPVLLHRSDWDRLSEAVARVPHRQEPGGGIGYATLHDLRRDPRSVRRGLVRMVQHNASVLESLDAAIHMPVHARLGAAVDVVRDGLQILQAVAGQPWIEDAEVFARFDAQFADRPDITANVLHDYFELRGAAELARLRHWDSRTPRPAAFDLTPARRFLSTLERYVIDHYSTVAERRQRKRWALAVALSPLLAVLAGTTAFVIHTWPESPVRSAPAAERRGGIVGHYFQGRKFQKRLTSQVDTSINFSSAGSVTAAVPPDNFSVRWKGLLFFPAAGSYSLCSESDDGNRVRFNGRRLIDDWNVHPVKRTCETVHVRTGWYPIEIEFFDATQRATMRLLRGPKPDSAVVVAAKDFCCRN